MCEPHRCGWLGTSKRVVFLSAVLGVLVHGLLDIALGLRVCHMDVDGLCDAHVLSTSYVQSLVVRQSITSTTMVTMRTAMYTSTGIVQGLAFPL